MKRAANYPETPYGMTKMVADHFYTTEQDAHGLNYTAPTLR